METFLQDPESSRLVKYILPTSSTPDPTTNHQQQVVVLDDDLRNNEPCPVSSLKDSMDVRASTFTSIASIPYLSRSVATIQTTTAASSSSRPIDRDRHSASGSRQRLLDTDPHNPALLTVDVGPSQQYPPTLSSILECPFYFLNCREHFRSLDEEAWLQHSLSHFRIASGNRKAVPPPSVNTCPICPLRIEVKGNRLESWRQRMLHVGHHHSRGYSLSSYARPDFDLFRYLWEMGVIDLVAYRDLMDRPKPRSMAGNGDGGSEDSQRPQWSMGASGTGRPMYVMNEEKRRRLRRGGLIAR